MKLSKYQESILEWVVGSKGNATCGAVAGSGKTTTLKLAAQELVKLGIPINQIKVIVFGKQNSIDMIEKFGYQWKHSIQTLHSVGFRVLQQEVGRFGYQDKIVSGKYKKIAEDFEYIQKRVKKRLVQGKLNASQAIGRNDHFVRLLDLVRLTLSDLSAQSIKELCQHHQLNEIYDFESVSQAIRNILEEGEYQAIENHIIDFSDMVYLPAKWQLGNRTWFETFKFVLVDEAQDLNAAQLELSLMLAGNKGRILSVGDENQAIFGFAGADHLSYQKIIDRTKATILPLSICYRCPKTHLDLVKNVLPDIPIEASENAKEGILEGVLEDSLMADDISSPHRLKVGDMVISRKTAPLVSTCIKLISRGIAATVKGKDIGKQIRNELEEIADLSGFTYSEFNVFLQFYQQAKIERLQSYDNPEEAIESLKDKLNAILIIYQSKPEINTVEGLCNYIEELFSDQESPITLCTCHRAKGLEAKRIFLLKARDMPLSWKNQKEWQLQQEYNLLYVALTRSTSELYIVAESDKAFPCWYQPEELKDNLEPTNPIPKFVSELSYSEQVEFSKIFEQNLNQQKSEIVTQKIGFKAPSFTTAFSRIML